MTGPGSKWTGDDVRRMHAYYITHPAQTVQAVAAHFGLTVQTLYKLFDREGLNMRRADQPSRARWMALSREQVEEMYAEYLDPATKPDEIAAKRGLCNVELYQAFQRFDLPTTRREARAQKIKAPADRCPAARTHEFCPHCPCPAPRCEEGHALRTDEEPMHHGGIPAASAEWHCATCRGKARTCACWDPAARTAAGFEAAYEGWQYQRGQELEARRRIRKLYGAAVQPGTQIGVKAW